MKILILVHNMTRKGGAYYHGLGFAKPLVRRGHEVTLMAIAPTEKWKITEKQTEGVKLVETPDWFWGIGRTGWDPWNTLRRILWLRGKQFDIVHTVDTRPAVVIPALFARWMCGAKWVADWTDWWGRGGAASERKGWLVRTVIGPVETFFEEVPRPYADGTIAISHALFDRAKGLGIDPKTMLRLPPGSDPDTILELSVADARSKLKLDESGPIVGYLGNIYPRDAELLFDTMRALKHGNAKLMFIGGGSEKIEVPEALKARVIRTGHVAFNQMLEYLCACEVLALPLVDSIANRGRWPSKVNEYVAVGRPTVACGIGDVAELLANNQIGLVVRPDAAEFAARVDELLADPAAATAMGDRARQLARTSYSHAAVGEALEKFFVQTLNNHQT